MREKVEDIYAVDVNVKGHPDVVSALAHATNYEDMVDSNAVECPVCERKVGVRCVVCVGDDRRWGCPRVTCVTPL